MRDAGGPTRYNIPVPAAIALLACAFMGPAACQHELPLPKDPFSTRTAAPLSIALADAAEAQRLAADDIEAAMAALDRPPPPDMTGPQRAEISRTLLRRVESRVQAADTVLVRANARGRDVVERLRADLREFTDDRLYRPAKDRANRVEHAFDDAMDALLAARKTLPPCVTPIRDRQLFDHAMADREALTPRPPPAPQDAERLARMRRSVDAASDKVRRAVGVFRGDDEP